MLCISVLSCCSSSCSPAFEILSVSAFFSASVKVTGGVVCSRSHQPKARLDIRVVTFQFMLAEG
jgi:hypothetical protein